MTRWPRDARRWWRAHLRRMERVWILVCVTFTAAVGVGELIAHGSPW